MQKVPSLGQWKKCPKDVQKPYQIREIVKKIQIFHFISSHMKKSIWKIEKNASENGVQLWVTWVYLKKKFRKYVEEALCCVSLACEIREFPRIDSLLSMVLMVYLLQNHILDSLLLQSAVLYYRGKKVKVKLVLLAWIKKIKAETKQLK